MRKKGRRAGAFFMAMAMLLITAFSTVSVAAAGLEDAGTIVDGSLLSTEKTVADSDSILTRGNILSKGTAELCDFGNRTLGMAGSTTCHVTCSQVICNLYLEQYDEEAGVWNSYKNWNYSTTNAYALTKTVQYKVSGGHWYRLCGAHIAIKGGTVESITTATDGIWID